MNLLETRNALDTLYSNYLLQAYTKVEKRLKKNDSDPYWPIDSMCHDYLQLGGYPDKNSPFRNLIAQRLKKETNDFLHPNERITYAKAIIRNQNLTLQQLRKLISVNENLNISGIPSFEVDKLVRSLQDFVFCGGVLEELSPKSKTYQRKMDAIKESPYNVFLPGIISKSEQNLIDRYQEQKVEVQFNTK